MTLDTRPKPLDRRGFHVGHAQHGMRIAHGHRAYLDIRALDVQGVHGASASAPPPRPASAARADRSWARPCPPTPSRRPGHARAPCPRGCPSTRSRPSSRRASVQQSRDTARAIAALFDLRAVGIENPIEHAALRVARRFQHQRLIEADARMPIGEGAQPARVQWGAGGGRRIPKNRCPAPASSKTRCAWLKSIADAPICRERGLRNVTLEFYLTENNKVGELCAT